MGMSKNQKADYYGVKIGGTRHCHDCGRPTTNYRCHECWVKRWQRLGIPIIRSRREDGVEEIEVGE